MKRHRLWTVLCFVCGGLALALLAVDRFRAPVPVWLELALCAIFVFALVRCLRKSGLSVPRMAVATAAGAAVSALILYECLCDPYWNSVTRYASVPGAQPMEKQLTAEEAREDLVFAYHMLQRTHPDLYGFVPEHVAEAMQNAHSELRAANDTGLTTAETARVVESVLSTLRDAHTVVGLNDQNPRKLRTAKKHEENGELLMAVNGIPLSQLLEEHAPQISTETESWGEICLRSLLTTSAGLEFLGIPAEQIEYTWEAPDGTVKTETATASDFITAGDQPSAAADPFVSYEIDPERSLATLTLKECVNSAEYEDCLRRMFTDVREQKIRHVAVDLRGNPGGDTAAAREFLRYIDVPSYHEWSWDKRLGILMLPFPEKRRTNARRADLVFDGDLYVLIDASSFSAAMMFAQYVTDNDLGTLIGQTSGASANAHGDTVQFQLPNSRLLLNIAGSSFHRLDGRGDLVEPDIPCAPADAESVLHQVIEKRDAAAFAKGHT